MLDPACANEAERVEAMKWMVSVVKDVTKLPLALDSTNYDAIEEGLKLIDDERQRRDSLINSVPAEQEKWIEFSPWLLNMAAKLFA